MCKGSSLESIVDLASFDRILYCGDGCVRAFAWMLTVSHNDFCTTVRLRKCARERCGAEFAGKTSCSRGKTSLSIGC